MAERVIIGTVLLVACVAAAIGWGFHGVYLAIKKEMEE